MRQKTGPDEPGCKPKTRLSWLTGNIRRKLTLFVVVILFIVVGFFWFFSIYLLPQAYEQYIVNDLSGLLNTVTGLLNEAHEQGLPLLNTRHYLIGGSESTLSQEALELLVQAEEDGRLEIGARCLDIGDADARCVLLADGLRPRCVLHSSVELGITADGETVLESERNGSIVRGIRSYILQNGDYMKTIEGGQIVLGGLAGGGQLTVTVSANLERIDQAVDVLQKLMVPLSALMALFSITAAWIFSRWFTQPVNKLSAAAREVAKGNYEVQVENCGEDEIGDLSRDFNTMAREVGRSAELQRDLLANVSHDLRTPLTLIKGYAETVRDLTGDNPEKRTEQLNVIVDESDRLSALVGSVMELSRMSSGTLRPEPVRFDLSELCEEVAYRYQGTLQRQGQTFDFAREESCEIMADPALVERILHNLLGNAINHMGPDGYVGLYVYKTRRGTVRVDVIDHGAGINPDDMPHLYDRYYRSRADAGKPGTGLGLAITKAMYVAMGFEYGADSRPGAGATFWFETPLAAEGGAVAPR